MTPDGLNTWPPKSWPTAACGPTRTFAAVQSASGHRGGAEESDLDSGFRWCSVPTVGTAQCVRVTRSGPEQLQHAGHGVERSAEKAVIMRSVEQQPLPKPLSEQPEPPACRSLVAPANSATPSRGSSGNLLDVRKHLVQFRRSVSHRLLFSDAPIKRSRLTSVEWKPFEPGPNPTSLLSHACMSRGAVQRDNKQR